MKLNENFHTSPYFLGELKHGACRSERILKPACDTSRVRSKMGESQSTKDDTATKKDPAGLWFSSIIHLALSDVPLNYLNVNFQQVLSESPCLWHQNAL